MSWMTVAEWTKVPEVLLWASDGKSVFQARYLENLEEEIEAGSDEGYFTAAFFPEQPPAVVFIWTGENEPSVLPPSLPLFVEKAVDEGIEEINQSAGPAPR